MTAAISLGRLQRRCAVNPRIPDLRSIRSPILSHSLSSSSSSSSSLSSLSRPRLPLSRQFTRLLTTATTTSHPTQPTTPPPPPHLTPSQLRAASAIRAQQAVLDAKQFEENRARVLRNKNVGLGLVCVGFVVWCYWFSVWSVRKSADSLTGSDVVEIERELDEEERLKAGERK